MFPRGFCLDFNSLSVCLFAGEIEFDPSEVVLAKREPVLEFVLEIGREIDNLITDIDKGQSKATRSTYITSIADDLLVQIKVIPDYFHETPTENVTPRDQISSASHPKLDPSGRPCGLLKSQKNFRSASFMLNLLNLKGLSWGFGSDGQEKVELTAAELESLRSQLANLEEREAHLRAQLEHVDEILRSSRLSGYLYIRTRWAALPGEPPPIDDMDVDDWLPRFVVLHGSCIFFYLLCTDISPQDSTLLSDIVKVESLPSFAREDETYHAFSIMTQQGLRYECSCASDIQVKSWLTELEGQCKLRPHLPNGLSEHL